MYMKRKKTLLILCIVLAVAVVGIIAEKLVEKHIDSINTIDEEVFAVDADSVTEITIKYGDTDLDFVKEDDSWADADDDSFPVNQDTMADFLALFESVHASFVIEDVEDYSQYGISSPECTITFISGDDKQIISFGDFSSMDSKRYISVDSGEVYLIDEDILTDVGADKDAYMQQSEIPDFAQLESMTITGESNANVVYDEDGSYTYSDDYEYYYKNGENYLPLSTSHVESLLDTISGVDLSEYTTYTATDKDFEKVGLDNPTYTITLSGQVLVDDGEDELDDEADETETDADSETDTETDTDAENDADAKTDTNAKTEDKSVTVYVSVVDDDNVYLRVDDDSIIYSVDASLADSLADAGYASLRPDEIVSVDWTKVSSISASIEGESYTISVAYDEDEGNTYTVDDEEVEFVTATGKIDGLTITEVGDDYEPGKEELSVSIQMESDTVSFALYRYDGDSCVATVDGQTVGLVSRDSMASLREEMLSSILNKGKEIEDTDAAEDAS